jgi:anti-anti-sigma factor
MQEPQAEFTDRSGRPCIVGEVDFSNVKELGRWLDSLDQTPLHIDMSGVTFMDSSALRALLIAARQNDSLRVVEPSAPIRRMFELTGVYDLLVGGTSN